MIENETLKEELEYLRRELETLKIRKKNHETISKVYQWLHLKLKIEMCTYLKKIVMSVESAALPLLDRNFVFIRGQLPIVQLL